MKKYIKIAVCLLYILSAFTSCGKFDDINTDPDVPTRVSAEMLASGGIKSLLGSPGAKDFVQNNLASKQIGWGENLQSYLFNSFGRSSLSGYSTIINMEKMVELAPEQDLEAYSGLAKFIKAYKLFKISMDMGDIPYSDALKGEEGNMKPKYDTQKDVMLHVLNDLEEAYTFFCNAKDFKGDPFVGGSVERWKKIVSVFQLQVLMTLSKKVDDPDLRVKERFAGIVKSSALMESNDDNFQLVYSDKDGQIYPLYYTSMYWDYPMVSSFLIDMLKEYKDYRLFYYARPAETKLKEGVAADSWDVFVGTDITLDFAKQKDLYVAKNFSGLNWRYTHTREGEPVVRLGYSQQNFILAEAVVRGWISGDASNYYKQGIKASMDFTLAHTPDETTYHQGRVMTPEVIADYLAQSSIQLTGDQEGDVEKIITQRYISSFMQYPWDAYFEYRRTGYPKLPINPATSLNTNAKDKVPVRWMYPADEYSYNKENVEEAVARQYDGNDEVNQLMWILK